MPAAVRGNADPAALRCGSRAGDALPIPERSAAQRTARGGSAGLLLRISGAPHSSAGGGPQLGHLLGLPRSSSEAEIASRSFKKVVELKQNDGEAASHPPDLEYARGQQSAGRLRGLRMTSG